MKKTLFAILALVSITQVSYADAYYTENDFDTSDGTLDLKDVAHTFSSDSFAISFNLDKSLTDINSSNDFFTLILGPNSYRVDIVSLGYMMTMSAGNSLSYTMDVPPTSGTFVLQIENNGVATLLYNNYGSLKEIIQINNPVYGIPDEIDMATLTFTGVTASKVTTWSGVVTAEDLANPTPAPAPSPTVPEPATATLSLLALAGLAARRRRR